MLADQFITYQHLRTHVQCLGVMDEKSSATGALGCYAQAAPVAFMPFLETSLAAVAQMADYFHEDVRAEVGRQLDWRWGGQAVGGQGVKRLVSW